MRKYISAEREEIEKAFESINNLSEDELVERLKENNGIVYNGATENGIRQVIRFDEYGFFSGYIGIPKGHKAFGAIGNNYDKASRLFDRERYVDSISYCEFNLPDMYEYDAQNPYLYVGFNHADSKYGRNFELVEKVWGKEKADKAFSLYSHLKAKPFPFDVDLNFITEGLTNMTHAVECCERYPSQMPFKDYVYVSDIEWDIDENEEVSVNELPEVVITTFDVIEDENGVLNPDKAIDIASDSVNFCIKSCTVNIQLEVPFSDAITQASKELGDLITKESLERKMLNEFPSCITATVPLDVVQDFYENHILSDDDWKSGNDIRLSKWLTKDLVYYPDDTRELLSWWNTFYDFDIHKAIPDIDEKVEEVKEYVSELIKEKDKEEDIER